MVVAVVAVMVVGVIMMILANTEMSSYWYTITN
jgi:hypothetical protein